MKHYAPLIIEEFNGIHRKNEPVTVGIPFGKGLVGPGLSLRLEDEAGSHVALQWSVTAKWPDGSIRWALLDFQVTLSAYSRLQLKIFWEPSENEIDGDQGIVVKKDKNKLCIETGRALFELDLTNPTLLGVARTNGNQPIGNYETVFKVVDGNGHPGSAEISDMTIETRGALRTTIKITGDFRFSQTKAYLRYACRVSFFANSRLARISFTITNPKAGKHPGGLWDLGDPGSIFIRDLSMDIRLNKRPEALWNMHLAEDPVPMDYSCAGTEEGRQKTDQYQFNDEKLSLYQDSSGGERWNSRNHVNYKDKVAVEFRGYRILLDNTVFKEGLRANPIVGRTENGAGVWAGLPHFWQNFPKSIRLSDDTISIGLFPRESSQLIELQGGEQKTHTVFLNLTRDGRGNSGIDWIRQPLTVHSSTQWYENANLFGESTTDKVKKDQAVEDHIHQVIEGAHSFFHRREIIDEYGWRNFGEFYADHEAVNSNGATPLISHYNNQYDGIYGCLIRYMQTGNFKWFILGDQLCAHVKDIDIYHTDEDRPEYNNGIFWHTDHHADAGTATHRCFSKKTMKEKQLDAYGGGPSLSHNYSTGLAIHYFMTGDESSRDTLRDIAGFVIANLTIEYSLSNRLVNSVRAVRELTHKNKNRSEQLVIPGKVYGLTGPGRASGNTLNTLLDAYWVTNENSYLEYSHLIITECISPFDDIEKRDLLDFENRWMYTVFLQSLIKYLHLVKAMDRGGKMAYYAGESLAHYADWMMRREINYLDAPQKLEFPNETWAAQELRKVQILLSAYALSSSRDKVNYHTKAFQLYSTSLKQFFAFETCNLTRPLVLLMLNQHVFHMVAALHKKVRVGDPPQVDFKRTPDRNLDLLMRYRRWKNRLICLSIRNEFKFVYWKFLKKVIDSIK